MTPRKVVSRLRYFVLILTAVLGLSASKPPKRLDLYLLIGQSNMAGRGEVEKGTQATNPKIWVINAQNQWVEAADPLHYDKPSVVGVGPGLAFAQEMQRQKSKRPIGLIPCAVGGSGIDDWQPGQKHEQTGIFAYDAMLSRVKEAQKRGRIKAILWHQGENDSNPEKAQVYEQKLEAFIQRLRKDINAPKVPFIMGTLGDFYTQKNPNALLINKILTEFPEKNPNVYVVSAAGLTDKGDTTHFDAASARELGKRYAEKLWSILKK
ncbi:sialate O-acetylesterase [Rhabdobacter roseus]|uniref:Sialate O-acetylesterase domain-containing protein n=1 Tax=Rhabdobacter roseus TaxID=1655419 RepID=A0A840U5Z7_9BACT|nr:sialate O-acetylesterase [Rhabdobacter roseus]MBB5287249.1 hypothetical protein [Rhabdobacter roseus]